MPGTPVKIRNALSIGTELENNELMKIGILARKCCHRAYLALERWVNWRTGIEIARFPSIGCCHRHRLSFAILQRRLRKFCDAIRRSHLAVRPAKFVDGTESVAQLVTKIAN